jgi:trk system potassium uptake protein TrkA
MALYAVIGLGQFGHQVAVTLAQRGVEVLAIDEDERKVEEIKDQVAQAVKLDSTDEEAMRAAGLEDVHTAVVALGEDFEATVLTTAVMKNLGVGRILARASSPLQGRILELVGAHRVIYPEVQMATLVARGLVAPHVLESIPLATGHSLADIRPRDEWIGKSLRDLDLRARFGVNVVAIRRRAKVVGDDGEVRLKDEVNDIPSPGDVLGADDVLVVVGSDERIEQIGRS